MKTDPDSVPNRARDRAATEQAIVAAARAALAEDGFQNLGVNAVARRAGCDKQLIYRYFGGLDGLMEAVGKGIAEDLRDRLQPLAADGAPASYRALIERMMLGFLRGIRQDALTRRIMAWEVAGPSELVNRLTLARSKAMTAWVGQARGALAPPPGVDAPAVNATLLAAIQHLALSGAAAGEFSGLPLRSEADWMRVETTIRLLVAAAYPEA